MKRHDRPKTRPRKYLEMSFEDKEMIDQLTTHLYRGHIRDMDRKHFLMAWSEVVYDCSGLNFTYQSDKLIALAGIP